MDDLYDNAQMPQEAGMAERPRRARERHRRRQERRAMAVPTRRRASVPQLVPAGSIQMPQLTAAQIRLLIYAAVGLIAVLGLLAVISQLTGAATAPARPPNVIWLGTEWTYGLDEDAALPDLVNRLREHRIGTVYAWVSWLKDDLNWGGRRDGNNTFDEVQETVKTFAADFKQQYPESRLVAWISVPASVVDISSDAVQQAVAAFASELLEEHGFDGIHLNVEPVWNNDTGFLALLNEVRDSIGEEALLSAAIPPDWSPIGAGIPVPPLIVPGTVWDDRYKQSVALLVDELAIMAYNSGLTRANNNTPEDYSEWMAYQVKTYADAVASLDIGSGAGAEIVIGIPTYDAEPPGHDPMIENIPSAVDGIRMGMEQAGANARYVRGAAIYAEWETDETEWAQFMFKWLNPDA